jgi:glycosyltransferase involved in cell wall biosynthesis
MTARRLPRRPRVLYLAFFFPPSRGSGVYRARATANHLAEQDWEVTVCASPLRFLQEVTGSVDTSLSDSVDPRIRVERPALHHFTWERDIRRYGRFRGTLPVQAQQLYAWGLREVFPEHYASWALAAVGRALRLHARRPFDVVVATGNPFASFAAAWLLNRITGLPYVLDYRDSWTLDQFTDGPKYPPEHAAWPWERRVLERATGTLFVNEAMRTWHAERYPKAAVRMSVVPNGWDPELLPEAPAPGSERERNSRSGPPRFGYVGTVTDIQPLEELVAAFRRARTHPALAGAELHLHGHLGFFRHKGRVELLRRLGLQPDPGKPGYGEPIGPDTGIRYLGASTKAELGAVYRSLDVLVFLTGGARYVTTGKVFEYMAQGSPIVSVHSPEIAAEEVLDGYPLWFNAGGLDTDALAQSMIAAAKQSDDLDPAAVRAARRHADRYARAAVLAPLEQALRGVAGQRARIARPAAN